MSTKQERLEWFREARFGMFIHWGVYSVIHRGTWIRRTEQIPADQYESCARRFTAKNYKPEDWARLARDAGMKYMVLTSKHHDGYCLFDTKTTDFNSVKVGPKKDLVAEYIAACRKYGLRVGLYFSLPDWSKPGFYNGPDKDPDGWAELLAHDREQVRELCTQYGKIDLLWYDMVYGQSGDRPMTGEDFQSRKLNRMVRRLQPDIVINDRSLVPEDYSTSEQEATAPKNNKQAWEACMTIGNFWSYVPDDTMLKSSRKLVHTLTGIIATGGNFLLNVGPRADGTILAPQEKTLREIGGWLKKNGKCIYGAGRSKLDPAIAGVSTEKGKDMYLVVHWWPGRTLCLPNVPFKIASARILSTGQKLRIERDATNRLLLHGLPAKAPDPLSTVIVLNKAK